MLKKIPLTAYQNLIWKLFGQKSVKVLHDCADKGSIYDVYIRRDSVVDIKVGSAPSVKMDPLEKKVTVPSGRKTIRLKDRRKKKHDRRRSVRDGIFVSLSVDNDRRVLKDRRKTGS